MTINDTITEYPWMEINTAKVLAVRFIEANPKLVEAYTSEQAYELYFNFSWLDEFGCVPDKAIVLKLLDKFDWTDLLPELEPPYTEYLFKILSKYCQKHWNRKFRALYRRIDGQIHS